MSNPALQEKLFYVADSVLYTLEGTGKKKTPILWLARHTASEPNNLILNHLDDKVNSSFEQLTKTHNYYPNTQEAQRVMQANSTLKIYLTQLRLKGKNKKYCFIEIDTTNYNLLNSEERKLAERFYGQGTAFETAMNLLATAGIKTTKVYVLNPAYVQKEAVHPIARAAWRSDFCDLATSNIIDYGLRDSFALFGVRRGVAVTSGAAGAPHNLGVPSDPLTQLAYETAYNLIINHPELLDQKKASGLSRVLTAYISK